MIDETFLTTEEVLEYLQVNLRTVYRLIKAGKIPAVRVGRQWRFPTRALEPRPDIPRPSRGAPPSFPAPPPAPPPPPPPPPPSVDEQASDLEPLPQTPPLPARH